MDSTFVEGEYGKGILVILGAGASFDALGPTKQNISPPLTNLLAESSSFTRPIVEKYPLSRPVIVKLRDALAQSGTSPRALSFSLEEALAKYRMNSANNPMTLMQITAFRFYLRDLLYEAALRVQEQNDGINGYTRLVHELVDWSNQTNRIVCFVNFNFDPLLEWACQLEFPFKPERLKDYSGGKRIFVLKPHGSVLWSWQDPGIPTESDVEPFDSVIECGEPASEGNFTLHASKAPRDAFREGDTNLFTCAYPALALPMTGQKTFVWPEDQENLFKNRFQIGTFGKVLTIGWRGNEKHFLEIMPSRVSNNSAIWSVIANSPGDEEEIMKNLWPATSHASGIVPITTGFHNFIYGSMFDSFLKS
jgi:hypothetical protein